MLPTVGCLTSAASHAGAGSRSVYMEEMSRIEDPRPNRNLSQGRLLASGAVLAQPGVARQVFV